MTSKLMPFSLAILILAASMPLIISGSGSASFRGYLPPNAVISSPVSNTTFEPNQTIYFNGNGSNDPDGYILAYQWNFGDNYTSYYPAPVHAYYVEGIYQVNLVVMDNDNMTDTASISVIIAINKPPVAVISAPQNNSSHYINDTVAFASNGSYDPEQGAIQYLWDFGDGTNSTAASAGHRYLAAGNFTVKLTVSDPRGLKGSATLRVLIARRNSAPVTVLSAPLNGSLYDINQTVNFSAAGSSDPEQDILSFSWNFGDGNFAAGRDVTHVFTTAGNYLVSVRATDAPGLNSSASIVVTVKPRNNAPIAVISSPITGSVYLINQSITFSASGSVDPDSYDLVFLWDFGDGQNGSGSALAHRYPKPGNYTVRLVVSDGKLQDAATICIVVRLPNRPPVAVVPRITPGIDNIRAREVLTFFDNGSYDPDQDVLTFKWDFSDNETGAGPWVNHSFARPGTYIVTLTVSDTGLRQSSVSVDVSVSRWAPSAVIAVVNPSNVWYAGDTAILTGANSSDPFGFGLSFLWKCNGTTIGLITNITYKFSLIQKYSISLEVGNGELKNTTSLEFNVLRRPVAQIDLVAGQKNLTLQKGVPTTQVGQMVHFRFSGATAGLACHWDFGDGNINDWPVQSASYRYSKPGRYNVTLTVSDGFSTSSVQQEINVRARPVAVVASDPTLTYVLVGISLMMVMGLAAFFSGTEIGLLAIAPLFVLLYSKIRQDQMLDNYTRGQIHGYIVANPGDHYNSIREALKLNNGTLAYHLRRLEVEKIVKSRTDGVFKRFYPVEMRVPDSPGGETLSDIQKVILGKVGETPGISQKDIAALLNVSAATVNYHMFILMEKKMVLRERAGMKVRYFLTDSARPFLEQAAR